MKKLDHVSCDSLLDWTHLGSGTFGSIYKARHVEWNLDVAVKTLNRSVPHDLQDLISEAQKMYAASASQHVTRLFGILEDPLKEKHGIVMEYMERDSLYHLISYYYPIPWALKFRILHEVALGMNWLHSLSTPLLHLDLKTKNVLLNTDLHIKVSDFGLSKFTHNSPNCDTDSECVGGTLEYMPPEAFQDGYVPDKSTDVYSFAILTSVVLTGNEPYPDAESFLIRYRIPRGDRPELCSEEEKQYVKCLSAATELTKQCWHDDKHKRPPFSKCCNQWEQFFRAHKNDILIAVREVQDKMMSSTATVSETPSTSTITSCDMTEAIKRMENLNITQEPSVQQHAVPMINRPGNIRETQHKPAKSVKNSIPNPNQTRPMPSFTPSFPFNAIYIYGDTNGIQIGNNNVMNIKHTHEKTCQRYHSKGSKGQAPGQPPKTQTSVQKAADTRNNIQQSPVIPGAVQRSHTSQRSHTLITSNISNVAKNDPKPLEGPITGSGNTSSQQNQHHRAEQIQAKPQIQIQCQPPPSQPSTQHDKDAAPIENST
ncbi:receptor-interacting serine/threonine-protein kinase 3 [Spea bombifrons]|uniref:receptor-interacting serine/threonine-protein kinase 3 n=1 Tax=Spea bombifrons TaxID=233779 RepID=UPI00234AEBBF|nr:receptor-interacting serine/threonine-protein kinase 3 [Spea bombifrons]